MRNNSDLFYVCSLIEFIGRKQKRKRSEVVADLGRDTLVRLYGHADVFTVSQLKRQRTNLLLAVAFNRETMIM